MSFKQLSLLVLMCLIAKETYSYRHTDRDGKTERTMCTKKKACYDLNNNCVCYCSRKCGPRAKTPDDNPVYVANDPEGHYCYCKPWDFKNYSKMKCGGRNSRRTNSKNTYDDENDDQDDESTM